VVLLDPRLRPEDWLAYLQREAEASYGAERALQLQSVLERLAQALAASARAERELKDLRRPPERAKLQPAEGGDV
jgi:hypothetical protein